LQSLGRAAFAAVVLLAGAMVGMGTAQCSDFPALDTPGPPSTVARARPSFDSLERQIASIVDESGGTAGVSLVELGGDQPQTWSTDGDTSFVAASTYKLPLLMMESQEIAAGSERPGDRLCYEDGDWEDGWYADYEPGACYTRAELMRRIGQDSDNTAAHILVRYEGSSSALNAYAAEHGAMDSTFYYPNTTTSNDLARLWVNEASGSAGGSAAQQYLYPLLTDTSFEDGIPAGVPGGTTVVHKIGELDDVVNDAALVESGARGSYVLVVCTAGLGGDPGWKLVADISRAVWQFEATR
jgi:beta-lactamase class A